MQTRKSGCSTQTGTRYRELNQDAFLVVENVAAKRQLWGVFDGHQFLGEIAAQTAVNVIKEKVLSS